MSKLKDKIYDAAVKKNGRVWYEYERYVREHLEEHKLNPIKSHWILLKLNWFYRIKKGNTPYIYWDTPLCPPEILPNLDNKSENLQKNEQNIMHNNKSLQSSKSMSMSSDNLASKKEDVLSNRQNAKREDDFMPTSQVVAAPQKKTVRKGHLPYLDGAESEYCKREEAIIFAKSLLKYDVISFDVFDTLLLRPFRTPADLFMIVGESLNRGEFYRIRRSAEQEARETSKAVNGTTEITINDIYKIIEDRTGLSQKVGIETEITLEKRYCMANPYMKRVFDLLIACGKTIIIVSDMYLNAQVIGDLLKQNGFEGYEKLYVSCEYHVSKRSGELFYNVLKDYEGKSIIHIGDNIDSDIQSARKVGLDTRFYKSCNEIGNPFRADGMSELTGSTYAGIINNHLHNGIKTYSPYYEYGFIYGGIYILGFCEWIHRKVKEKNIDKILFLSRDGYIYKKIFDYLFDDTANEYFLWSRIANTKFTTKKNKEDFLRRCIFYRILRDEERITIDSLLETLALKELGKYLSKYSLSKDMVLCRGNQKIVEQLFIDHWNTVVESYSIESQYLKSYIANKIGKAKKVAIIDVGWLGSGPKGLKYLVEEEYGWDCEVYCYQAASRSSVHTDPLTDLMNQRIEAYLFSRMHNRIHYDQHTNTNKGTNNIYFELFTQAITPSYSGLNKVGDFLFDIPEVENYKIITEIEEGITDYVREYKKTFKDTSYMFNISGYDAYCAYRMIIRNLDFMRNYFSNLSYARGVGGDNKKLDFATLGEIMESAGL